MKLTKKMISILLMTAVLICGLPLSASAHSSLPDTVTPNAKIGDSSDAHAEIDDMADLSANISGAAGEPVTLAEAKNMAVDHILSVMQTKPDSPWNSGVRIRTERELLGANDRPSAYYFELETRNKEAGGYVITSANTADYPILEYAEEGESFLTAALSRTAEKTAAAYKKTIESSSSKIYYLCGLTYAVEHSLPDGSTFCYDVSDAACRQITKADFFAPAATQPAAAAAVSESGDYSILWARRKTDWQAQKSSNPTDSAITYGSNPPSDDYITVPASYESGYSSSKYNLVTSGQTYYLTMDELSWGSVCAPTAATNLCLYWYVRDTTKYMNLYKNGSWDDVFWCFFEYMETDPAPNKGAHCNKHVPAFQKYFREVGLTCSPYHFDWFTDSEFMIGEINEDRPFILCVYNHPIYDNHAVLAIGYSQYIYGSGLNKRSSTYIKIADGWTHYATRYVWFGGWNGQCMTCIIPR